MLELVIAVLVIGAVVHLGERALDVIDRRGRSYTGTDVALAVRAAAYRAADPEMSPELVEGLAITVLEDLDAGVLTDPAQMAP
jgi:hypothetical protein